MTPRHHPSEDLLAACAAGTLRPGADVVVRAHLAFCQACRAEIGLFESLGGALLESEGAEELTAGALERTLAAINGRRRASRSRRPARSLDAALLPRTLDGLSVGRRRWMAPGVWMTPLDAGRRSRELVYMLRIDRGMVLPRHTHQWCEFTCVLHGGFSDAGAEYLLGDFIVTDEAVEHSPRVEDDEACVTLASTDAPLVMRGLVGRLFQSFVRI
jgi:putative transcriptional regulator